jgi:hypothetical protein
MQPEQLRLSLRPFCNHNYWRDLRLGKRDWLQKQFIHTILFGFLGASGFAQTVEILREAPFVHGHLSYNAARWKFALTGTSEGAGKDAAEHRALDERANSCASVRSTLVDIAASRRDGQHFRKVPIWQFSDSKAFFFVSGMTIDADGAPNAYNPDDTGLDELANAGAPGRWNGIITDRDGNPLIQRKSDPFPGYYISCTSLSDRTKKFTDPTGYVDASKIPYVALPQDLADRGGVRLGDLAIVMNLRNGKSSFAIYADIGTLGEGSIALADALGIRSDARRGGEHEGILYLFFPGSGNLQPRTIGEIQSKGDKLVLHHAGRLKDLSSCAQRDHFADGDGGF